MGLIVSDAIELAIIQLLFNSQSFRLRLYSNDYTPDEFSTIGNFTEVTGGGYIYKQIEPADWAYAAGDPTRAVAPQEKFIFTGPTTGPGTIYGYYMTTIAGVYTWGERFSNPFVPFSPIANSSIWITPRFEVS